MIFVYRLKLNMVFLSFILYLVIIIYIIVNILIIGINPRLMFNENIFIILNDKINDIIFIITKLKYRPLLSYILYILYVCDIHCVYNVYM